MIIDMHTHAGRPSRSGPVDRSVLATMRAGHVGAAVVSAIADMPVIQRNPATRALELIREPEPGECLAYTREHLAVYDQAGMPIAREPAEITAESPSLVLAIEGCDFLEGNLDRLDEMAARGVRSIQLTHYRINETGDIQTAPPRHHGLTRFGADAVRRMNDLGIMVDVAHCSEATAAGVAAATSHPILCTHANLAEPGAPGGDHPRFLSPAYASLVARTGGVIGAWIAVLWEEKFDGMIRHLFRLIDAVGVDHVGIGTDMPAGVGRTEMPDFTRHAEIEQRLIARGMTAEEVAKICSGNWLRVFSTVRDGRTVHA